MKFTPICPKTIPANTQKKWVPLLTHPEKGVWWFDLPAPPEGYYWDDDCSGGSALYDAKLACFHVAKNVLAGDWDLAKKYDQDLNILHDKGQGYVVSHLISDSLLPEKVSSLPIPQHGLEAGCYEYAHALFPQYNLWQHLQTLSISIKAKSPSV